MACVKMWSSSVNSSPVLFCQKTGENQVDEENQGREAAETDQI